MGRAGYTALPYLIDNCEDNLVDEGEREQRSSISGTHQAFKQVSDAFWTHGILIGSRSDLRWIGLLRY